MKRDEVLHLALEHNFGHCEVGVRMVGLVNAAIALERARNVQRCLELMEFSDLAPGAQACIDAIMREALL